MALCTDICIPVPWGSIRGIQFGNPSGHLWIGLHGWLDNAATWQSLAPHLPEDVRLVALDLPGHGQSDGVPLGLHYHELEHIAHIHRAVKFLKCSRWKL